MERTLTIGIIGDYDAARPTHTATREALAHAAGALPVEIDPVWIPTPDLESEAGLKSLQRFHGLWASPGGPYRSTKGALEAIRWARERGRPFFGT